MIVSVLSNFSMNFLLANRIGLDGTLRSVASHLGAILFVYVP